LQVNVYPFETEKDALESKKKNREELCEQNPDSEVDNHSFEKL